MCTVLSVIGCEGNNGGGITDMCVLHCLLDKWRDEANNKNESNKRDEKKEGEES
jgi:hypothetical protein